ncbi:hypothetical protein [Zooshikella sp. RANM57]|uniref:hypothetical protein n=1 Tax=Zooshikella sp. RANM57 TaxID=3425863 RepID=UPI003D6FD1E4
MKKVACLGLFVVSLSGCVSHYSPPKSGPTAKATFDFGVTTFYKEPKLCQGLSNFQAGMDIGDSATTTIEAEKEVSLVFSKINDTEVVFNQLKVNFCKSPALTFIPIANESYKFVAKHDKEAGECYFHILDSKENRVPFRERKSRLWGSNSSPQCFPEEEVKYVKEVKSIDFGPNIKE